MITYTERKLKFSPVSSKPQLNGFEDNDIYEAAKRHPLVSSENFKKRNFLGHSKDDTFEVFELPQIAERWHFFEPLVMPRLQLLWRNK